MDTIEKKTPVGESEEWEAAYRQTRRSLPKRKRRLRFFDWPDREAAILDLGSGDGLDLAVMKMLGFPNTVAFDASPQLLAAVQGTRVVGDAHHLPFGDRTFDIVFANSVLHHFDFPKMVGGVHRVLKPGGSFCFMEPRPTWVRSLLDRVTMARGSGLLLPFFKHRRQSLREEWEVYQRWLELFPRVRSILRDEGFVPLREKKTSVGILSQWKKC